MGGQEGRLVPFTVVERASGRLVGSTGICIHGGYKVPALTVFVGSSVWGRGDAAEAATAALNFGFEKHDFGEVIASVMVENAASQRVMQKLGFAVTPSYEERSRGMILYRLTSEQWQSMSCDGYHPKRL